MPEDINQQEDDGIFDDDNDEEDDVHPSVAWLYPPAKSSSGSTKKPTRRTLAVDYGTYRVGLAIGLGISPRVVPGITNHGSDLEVARQVLVRARGEGIRDIVVGLPLVRYVFSIFEVNARSLLTYVTDGTTVLLAVYSMIQGKA